MNPGSRTALAFKKLVVIRLEVFLSFQRGRARTEGWFGRGTSVGHKPRALLHAHISEDLILFVCIQGSRLCRSYPPPPPLLCSYEQDWRRRWADHPVCPYERVRQSWALTPLDCPVWAREETECGAVPPIKNIRTLILRVLSSLRIYYMYTVVIMIWG
jgi:hypothetical protein